MVGPAGGRGRCPSLPPCVFVSASACLACGYLAADSGLCDGPTHLWSLQVQACQGCPATAGAQVCL